LFANKLHALGVMQSLAMTYGVSDMQKAFLMAAASALECLNLDGATAAPSLMDHMMAKYEEVQSAIDSRADAPERSEGGRQMEEHLLLMVCLQHQLSQSPCTLVLMHRCA
jgi:hypothetical protein